MKIAAFRDILVRPTTELAIATIPTRVPGTQVPGLPLLYAFDDYWPPAQRARETVSRMVAFPMGSSHAMLVNLPKCEAMRNPDSGSIVPVKSSLACQDIPLCVILFRTGPGGYAVLGFRGGRRAVLFSALLFLRGKMRTAGNALSDHVII